MKTFILVCAVAFSGISLAQSVDVKGVDTTGEGTTTIEIKKGKTAEEVKKPTEAKWEVTEGSADVEGEPAPTAKEARATWKQACDDWKKEFRNDNKENKILNVNCGTVSCGGDAGNKVCTSKASYKLKTRID